MIKLLKNRQTNRLFFKTNSNTRYLSTNAICHMKKSFKSQLAIAWACLLLSSGCSKTTVNPSSAQDINTTVFNAAATRYVVTTLVEHISSPQGITIDAEGNLYVASSANGSIQQISPAGTVTAFPYVAIGNSLLGVPEGLAMDAQHNLYFTDVSAALVNRISAAGIISRIAGGSQADKTGGGDLSQGFENPFGITLDKAGNLYVTDAGNAAIRKITPSGSVSNMIPAGPANSGLIKPGTPFLQKPEGIAVDAKGNLYLTDVANASVLKLSASGLLTTIAGGQGMGFNDGPGSSAKFNKPMGIAIDVQGNLFVADAANAAIRRIDPAGEVTTIAGGKTIGFADGVGTAAAFDSPEAIVIDAQGNLYISDGCYGAIRKITIE